MEQDEKTIADSLKRDIAQAVELYFVPVKAVVAAFNKAADRISHGGRNDTITAGGSGSPKVRGF